MHTTDARNAVAGAQIADRDPSADPALVNLAMQIRDIRDRLGNCIGDVAAFNARANGSPDTQKGEPARPLRCGVIGELDDLATDLRDQLGALETEVGVLRQIA